MLKNFVTIAVRNMMRSKSLSIINIAGLSLGVACCLLLALYIFDEMRYDKAYRQAGDLYRIVSYFHNPNQPPAGHPNVSPPVAMTMLQEVPDLESATRLLDYAGTPQVLLRYNDNVFYETAPFLADSTLFDVFDYKFIEGSPARALVNANSVVLTQRVAHKLFGDTPALDKTITIDMGSKPSQYVVTGIIEDIQHSFVRPNLIMSMTSDADIARYLRSRDALDNWAGQNFVPSYVRLKPGSDRAAVEAKMNHLLTKYGAEQMKQWGFTKTLGLEPVKDIYLYSTIGKTARINFLYIIGLIAAFILVIACINFMNLTTAKATRRATEVGLRKTMGAQRGALALQLFGEAMITVLVAMLLSVVLVQMALPAFNTLTGKAVALTTDNATYFVAALAGITLITGLVSGSYPALYLSRFSPAEVLKGKMTLNTRGSLLRKSLVVFQFTIAIVLVSGMMVISRQLDFIRNKDLGFAAANRIVLPLRTNAAKEAYSSIKKELANASAVEHVSATDYVPGVPIWNDLLLYPEGSSMDKAVYTVLNDVDYDYQEALDIRLLAGRRFTENFAAERGNIIINRRAAATFNLTPEQAVGQKLYMNMQDSLLVWNVIGVLEDFNQGSLRQTINPLAMQYVGFNEAERFGNMLVAASPGRFKEAIAALETAWKKNVNDTPFEFRFLDDVVQEQYAEDEKLSTIIAWFTGIAMVISCLGLYGLSSFMAEQKVKEIGIRKVMGARVDQIVSMMSREFLKLVVVAFVVSVPVSWYTMTRWLESFSYKAPLSVMLFVYAGVSALLVALITVSYESLKAATDNPVKALRDQ